MSDIDTLLAALDTAVRDYHRTGMRYGMSAGIQQLAECSAADKAAHTAYQDARDALVARVREVAE